MSLTFQKKSVIFAGSSEFSARYLEFLVKQQLVDIPLVITLPERPVGRGKALQKNPVHQKALSLGLKIKTVTSLKNKEEHEQIRSLAVDYLLVVAFGLIIPTWLLEHPKIAPLNIHASLLPRWRGASPIHRALQHADTQTGICLMIMSKGLDEGPVLSEKKVQIDSTDIFSSLEEKLLECSKTMTCDFFNDPQRFKPTVQEGKSTYADKITKNEGFITKEACAEKTVHLYRAFHLWPGLYALSQEQGLRVKLTRLCLKTQRFDGKTPGHFEVIDQKLFLHLQEGSIEVLEIQFPGKKPLACSEIIKHKNHPLLEMSIQ